MWAGHDRLVLSGSEGRPVRVGVGDALIKLVAPDTRSSSAWPTTGTWSGPAAWPIPMLQLWVTYVAVAIVAVRAMIVGVLSGDVVVVPARLLRRHHRHLPRPRGRT